MTTIAHSSSANNVQIDPQVTELLERLHQGGAYRFVWTVDQAGAKETFWFPTDQTISLDRKILADRHVYFGVHPTSAIPPTDSQGRPAQPRNVRSQIPYIASVACVFAEFDVGDRPGEYADADAILRHLENLLQQGIPYPSVIVRSGGDHALSGLQAVWLLSDPVLIDDGNREHVKAVQRAWVDLVGGDLGAKDLARVLRLPGFCNYKPKYGTPAPIVTFEEINLLRCVDWPEVEALTAPIRAAATQQTQKTAHVHVNGNGAGGGRNPWYVEAALNGELDTLAKTRPHSGPHGGRNGQLNHSAYKLGGYIGAGELDRTTVEDQLLAVALAIGLDEADARGTIRSGVESGMKKPTPAPAPSIPGNPQNMVGSGPTAQTNSNGTGPSAATGSQPTGGQQQAANVLHFEISDLGTARAVQALYPGIFAYNGAYGWMAYTGTHYETGFAAEARVRNAINATLAERVKQAAASGNMQAHQALIKFCNTNKGRVTGAEFQLQSLPSVIVSETEFDKNPDLLNTLSGVVDLRTKQIYPHDPSWRFTYCAPVAYVPGTDYSEWLDLLAQWLPAEQHRALQLTAGYSATGHTREEILAYLFGLTRSGKGACTETIRAVLGTKITAEIRFSTFTEERTGDSQNFDLAPLKPCRVVFASESNEYERFNEAKIKHLTGGNEIYCSFKHRDHFNYKPQFKIWLSSNHPVNADPDDDAVWGRIRIFHFQNSYLGREDKLLKERLLAPAMLQQVLAWIIDGAGEWYGLGSKGIPETSTGADLKQKRRDELDQLGQWIGEACEVGPNFTETNATLYGNYESWCKANGVAAKRNKSFTQAMNKRGFQNPRTNAGKKWLGIKLAHSGLPGKQP